MILLPPGFSFLAGPMRLSTHVLPGKNAYLSRLFESAMVSVDDLVPSILGTRVLDG